MHLECIRSQRTIFVYPKVSAPFNNLSIIVLHMAQKIKEMHISIHSGTAKAIQLKDKIQRQAADTTQKSPSVGSICMNASYESIIVQDEYTSHHRGWRSPLKHVLKDLKTTRVFNIK